METYDPKDISISFAGNLLTGFSEDNMVEIERNAPPYSYQSSVDGKGTRIRSRDKSYRVRLFLSASSPSNDILQSIASADDLGNDQVHPLSVVDLSGTSNFQGPESWIAEPASFKRGKNLDATEWVIDVAEGHQFVGGLGL